MWPLVPELITWTSQKKSGGNIPHKKSVLISNMTGRYMNAINVSITDFVVKGVTSKLMSLEHVLVTIEVAHDCRGVLQFELVSPGNTRALLAEPRSHDWYGDHIW